ncbi:hypothetical protein M5K25_028403 [Dendrobium thyrsiflorum]|uniref:Uncharacterized protein n=1 Tax=Dendrobium thyrsiflorum TaxID=117978 RepID=A0ABD0TTD4_DENTH
MNQIKTTVEERMSSMEGQVEDLRDMIKKMLEVHNQATASVTRNGEGRSTNSVIRREEDEAEIEGYEELIKQPLLALRILPLRVVTAQPLSPLPCQKASLIENKGNELLFKIFRTAAFIVWILPEADFDVTNLPNWFGKK